tara:strand:- start:1073 stop:1354 length:282 start_codon:yes stop_codon:yes gene_type:complete
MVKANDLINEQQKREKIKIESFKKVYSNIEKKIILASAGNFYYVWYEVPEFILGLPTYNLKDCIEYVKVRLTENQFEYVIYNPNIILIKWFPK